MSVAGCPVPASGYRKENLLPFNLSSIKLKAVDAKVKFAGETLKFAFIPGKLDEKWYEKQSKAMEEEDMPALVACVTDVLTSWDVVDENEDVVPLDAEEILKQDFPLPLFGMINQKIQQVASDGGESTKKAR